MVRNPYILFTFLLCSCFVNIPTNVNAQIRDYQIRSDSPKDSLMIMFNDTNSSSVHYGLGSWLDADSMIALLVGEISGSSDADWYERGTTTPPNNIGDEMYHDGNVSIGDDDQSQGKLSILKTAARDTALAIMNYGFEEPWIAMHPGADPDEGWTLEQGEEGTFHIGSITGGVTTLPFGIDIGAPSYRLHIEADGDILISDYPNSRDDGTPTNVLGTTVGGVIQSYPIADIGFMDNWLIAADGTGGTESITDNETVTFASATGLDATRSTSTVTYTIDISEYTTDPAIEGDESALLYDASGANHEIADVSEFLNTIEEGNTPVQSDNMHIDFQTLFDVATDGAEEVNISLDLSEATTVTTVESDDYMIMHDAGSAQHQKILWTDIYGDLITFEEDNVSEGEGNIIDVGTGIDLSFASDEADITLDFNEFTTDASPEGDEFVIISDGAGVIEKVAITDFGGGDGIYGGDGTTPTDVDASVTDSLEFNGTLKIINDANDFVGVGAQTPAAKLHVRNIVAGTSPEMILEATSEKVELQTKSISNEVQAPFTITVQNKDQDIDISGDYYQMANITFSKASSSVGGGAINFNVGYDSTNVDGVMVIKSRESGATDGLVNVVGGLRYKWTSSASTPVTLNTGDYGLSMTATGAKVATIPDAVTGIIGQELMIFNNATSGDITITITGGSGDTIYGDAILSPNESCKVICVAANKWIINN